MWIIEPKLERICLCLSSVYIPGVFLFQFWKQIHILERGIKAFRHLISTFLSLCRRRRWKWVTGGRMWKPCRAWRAARRCLMQVPPSKETASSHLSSFNLSLKQSTKHRYMLLGISQSHKESLYYSVYFCVFCHVCWNKRVCSLFHLSSAKRRKLFIHIHEPPLKSGYWKYI